MPGEGVPVGVRRLPVDCKLFSDNPGWNLQCRWYNACCVGLERMPTDGSWWAMHANEGPLTSQPIFCYFATLKGDKDWCMRRVPPIPTPACPHEGPGPSMNAASNKVTCPNLGLNWRPRRVGFIVITGMSSLWFWSTKHELYCIRHYLWIGC